MICRLQMLKTTALRSTTVRNFSYLLSGEGISRIIRVLATITMARVLDASDFGLLAIALTCHELIAVLANNGFGLYLLKQDERHYRQAANSVWILSWAWAVAMVGVQLSVAFGLDNFFESDAAWYVVALTPLHLLLPLAITQVYIIHRKGELGAFAGVTIAQNLVDCIATISLLYLGFGIWSIVIAKGISTLAWVLGIRAMQAWKFQAKLGFSSMTAPFAYTAPVLFSEYGKSIRQFGDNIIVGATMGAELLGLYYFAKNSGLGISMGLSQVSTTVATPRFAEITRSSQSDEEKFDKRMRLTINLSLCISILIFAQAALAPYYVPLLFGEKWTSAIPILAILCLSAVPRCIAEIHACLARNSHLEGLEASWNAAYTLAFLLVVAAASFNGLHPLAWAIVALNIASSLWIIDRTWQRIREISPQNLLTPESS